MISVLAQERLIGTALGALFSGIIVFEQRKSIYRLVSETQFLQEPQPGPPQMKEAISGRRSSLQICHLWNKTVDQTFSPVITSLSSRGW